MKLNATGLGGVREILFGLFAATFLSCSIAPNQAAAAGDVSVHGAGILRDGRPWIAKGVGIVGRTAPAAATKSKPYLEARAEFGANELNSVRKFGADLIRFQVSQAGTDPQSSIYSPDYVKEVVAAVKMARDTGFTVIVCLDSQKPSGLNEMGMPNEKAQRAWRTLAPLFANDRDVMLELFNEPAPDGPDAVQPYDWNTWQARMQPLVDVVRGVGAKNVLLVDGLYYGQVLAGAPPIRDPMLQVVYAIHPRYSPRLRTEPQWDQMFGNFAKTHAVLATEWAVNSFRPNCNNEFPGFAAGMLNYLRQRKIGLVGWAFDFPGTIFTGNFNSPLTSYNGFHCGRGTDFAAGELIARDFKGLSIP